MAIDMSAASKAPPRRSPPGAGSPAGRKVIPVQTERDRRREGLEGIAQLAQGILSMTRQYADAATVGMHGPNIAREIASLADEYEQVAKPVDVLIQTGPFAALIAVLLPFGLQICANHKLIDASSMVGSGVVPPEVLEAQMKAEIVRMQTQAMKEQQEALAAAQAAQTEYENARANGAVPVTA